MPGGKSKFSKSAAGGPAIVCNAHVMASLRGHRRTRLLCRLSVDTGLKYTQRTGDRQTGEK